MKIVENAGRVLEEALPFWVYERNKKKILSKLGPDGIEATLDQFNYYYTLPKEKILERLAEERQRATASDSDG
jgi:hypothetical protein